MNKNENDNYYYFMITYNIKNKFFLFLFFNNHGRLIINNINKGAYEYMNLSAYDCCFPYNA